jgi:hypothetical protein
MAADSLRCLCYAGSIREALKNLHQYPEHPGCRKGFSGQAWVDSRVVQSFLRAVFGFEIPAELRSSGLVLQPNVEASRCIGRASRPGCGVWTVDLT